MHFQGTNQTESVDFTVSSLNLRYCTFYNDVFYVLCGTNQTESIEFCISRCEMETVYSDTSSSSTESCEGVFHLGNNILVVRVGSDSEDDIISISDDENNPVSDQNVSSTVPNTGAEVGDNISVPKGSENVTMTSSVKGSEPPISKDSLLETEEKPIILPKLENNCQESFDESS